VPYEAKTADGLCPFCEIVAGRAKTPGVFWEDENHLAFLSIDPNTEGFSCVIPKAHAPSDILKMEDGALSALMIAAKKVAAVIETTFEDVGRVGFVGEGTGLDHAHIKLVPMHGTEHLKRGEWRQIPSGKELWFEKYEGWIASASGPRADDARLASLAERLRGAAERIG